MREMIRYIFGPIPLVSSTLAAAATTYIGPFGSYGVMDLPARAAYWFGIIYLSLVLSMHPRFFKRLKPELGQGLIRLSMQDHYLEVVTTKGHELILMRFADALEELEHYDGIQVHRSHWVARAGVSGARRDGAKLFLKTADGAEVPVSRSMKKAVSEAGYA